MNETDRILNKLGYVGRDPIKIAEIAGYIGEAEDFMLNAGVAVDQMSSNTAYTVKSIWAEKRNTGTEETLIKADSFVVNLIAQLRLRRKK